MGLFGRLFSKNPPPLLNGNAPISAHVDEDEIFQQQIAAAGESAKAVLAQLDGIPFESVSQEPYVVGYFGSLVMAHMDAMGLSGSHPKLRGLVMITAAQQLLGTKEAARAFAQHATTLSPKDKALKQGTQDAAQDVSMWIRSQGTLTHTNLMGWRVRRK